MSEAMGKLRVIGVHLRGKSQKYGPIYEGVKQSVLVSSRKLLMVLALSGLLTLRER